MARKSLTSEEYWRQREGAQRQKNITAEKEYAREIRRIYAGMMDNVQKEIESFYARYATKEGITLAEAKKRVSKLDIEAYERKAARYVHAAARDREANGKTDKNAFYFSKQANEEMRLYNLTMKVNRLEMLKANIGLELVSGFDGLQKFFDRKLTDRTLGEFRRQAGILGRSVQNNAKFAHAIVNASFHNATFSDRIWKEQAALKSELDRLLQIGLIQGRNPRVLARDLQKRFGVFQSDAERLMITELRRVQTEAQKQSYIRNGYEEYQFLALGSACPVCADLNEKHFEVKDMQPGVNAPPMHPNCRCSTSAYMDRKEFDRWLEEENRKMHERMDAEVAEMDAVGTQQGSMWHSFIERAALKALTGGRTSGKMGDTDGYTTIQAVEEFDFADQEATKRELNAFCESYQYAPEEHALVLSPTGKLYRLDGWSASVNTDLVGEDALKGATVIHNHPTTKEEGFYDSFSQQDIISAVQSKTGLEIVVSGKHIHAVFIDEDMSIERMNELYSTAQNRVRDRAIRTDNPIEFEQLEILEELSRMGVLQFVRIRG